MINEQEKITPEDLLESIIREESQRFKGKLKIFLGMAAGVGKTYAMLESAHKLKQEGIDVLVGTIDTHGRKETENLLNGLEFLPLRDMDYKESHFQEFDIDAALKRNPKCILIDELAHSNIPGCRHPKRWQDVMEIIHHGIDVYTTLNVQHIESLKDVIEKITGINIRETVPDLIIEQAAFIELVDISPDQLLQRLKEGNVYIADQSVIAAQNFFQEDRLTALREMVLRYAANKVDHDLKGMISATLRTDPWRARERLLVAVSHSPHSQKLIRITRNLAFNLDAPWYAVHVNNSVFLNENDSKILQKNLELARDLGAEVISTIDSDPAVGIQRIARQKNITQIIVGRTPHRWFFNLFEKNTIMDHLIRECSDIDLHIIRQSFLIRKQQKKWKLPSLTIQLTPYLMTALVIGSLAYFNWLFFENIGLRMSRQIFFLGTLLLSLCFNIGAIFFAVSLTIIIWIVLFFPSTENISLWNENIQILIFYGVISIGIGFFSQRARQQREIIYKREQSMEALYNIVKEIADSTSLNRLKVSIQEKLGTLINGTFEILIKTIEGKLKLDSLALMQDMKEQAAATWVCQNGQEAGWSTSTLPMTKNLYLPLKFRQQTHGVIVYQPLTDILLTGEEKIFLLTVCSQIGTHLEHVFAMELATIAEQQKQMYSVYRSILDLIQNLFEGPLLIIKESINEITTQHKKQGFKNDHLNLNIPIGQVENATRNLMRILENISAMIQLISGDTPIHLEKGTIKNLITACYEKFLTQETHFRWDMQVNETIPPFMFDYKLIELVLINLILHAIEYSLPNSMIYIRADLSGDYVVLSVFEEGQSIPEELIDISFESLYRLSSNGHSRLGMGLAIIKVIIELHKGVFKTESFKDKGTMFLCYLPLNNVNN